MCECLFCTDMNKCHIIPMLIVFSSGKDCGAIILTNNESYCQNNPNICQNKFGIISTILCSHQALIAIMAQNFSYTEVNSLT